MVVGGQGRLGQKLIEVLKRETEWEVSSVVRAGIADRRGVRYFDTASKREWKELLADIRWTPDVMVNCAAISDVDFCETHRQEAWETNVGLTEIQVELCRKTGGKLIQISTDHVFSGEDGPYTESSTPNPINYYGKSKLAADNLCIQSGIDCCIVRTMWLYGSIENGKPTFVDWVLANVAQRKRIAVPGDEFGNPTLTDDVAYGIIRVVEESFQGILNLAGPETVSRETFATAILQEWGFDPEMIDTVTSAELGRRARRPLRSGLLTLKARTSLGTKPTEIRNGLKTFRIQTRRRLER
jgi:dTDP-4-dehydrorhamnose reductase